MPVIAAQPSLVCQMGVSAAQSASSDGRAIGRAKCGALQLTQRAVLGRSFGTGCGECEAAHRFPSLRCLYKPLELLLLMSMPVVGFQNWSVKVHSCC